jgi:hypothetical protein
MPSRHTLNGVWRICLLWAGPVLSSAALVGLIARHRTHRARTLPVLLVALVLSDCAQATWEQANTWTFWFAKELVHAVLFLALGIEVGCRVFRPLPGARRTVVPWLLILIAVAAVLALTLPGSGLALAAVPRFLLAIGLLYGGIYAILVAHMVPVDPLHKALLLGFAPYLLFNAVSWGQVSSRWEHAVANVANPALFVLALLALVVAAWGDEPSPQARPALVRRLWPWR